MQRDDSGMASRSVGAGSLYFAAFLSVLRFMEPNQIKSEITALRARFDALRGYL